MKLTPWQFGRSSESVALRYLKKVGYQIIEKNYRAPMGEIDIIAMDKETLVFIEVKARRNLRFGNPKQAITWRKKRKISMAALYYLKTNQAHQYKSRFDVVSVQTASHKPQIEIIKNAFSLAYG